MKKIIVTSIAALGLAGMVAGSAVSGPVVMGDIQLDQIVAGKKPAGSNGKGTDTHNDDGANLAYEYDHANKDQNVLQDYDAGISTNKHLTCLSYGYIDSSGNYVATNYCNGDVIGD